MKHWEKCRFKYLVTQWCVTRRDRINYSDINTFNHLRSWVETSGHAFKNQGEHNHACLPLKNTILNIFKMNWYQMNAWDLSPYLVSYVRDICYYSGRWRARCIRLIVMRHTTHYHHGWQTIENVRLKTLCIHAVIFYIEFLTVVNNMYSYCSEYLTWSKATYYFHLIGMKRR